MMRRRTLRIPVLLFGALLLGVLSPTTGVDQKHRAAEAAPPLPRELLGSIDPSMSSSGRFIAFTSGDRRLYPRGTNHNDQVLVWDRDSGHIEVASVTDLGDLGNGNSGHAAVSADGRFVAFESAASNLVVGDTNRMTDIFVRDRQKRITERTSVGSRAEQSNDWSARPAISGDGRFVAFCSQATNLVPADTNGEPDIFVRDRTLGKTERLSVGQLGEQADADSTNPSISADGWSVAFHSWADNLAPGDENVTPDVFVRDRKANATIRADLSALPKPQVQAGYGSRMSADGRFLAVMPVTLVNWDRPIPRDVDESLRLLVWDRRTNTSHRVGPAGPGKRGNLHSTCRPAISADGRLIAFDSQAADLVPDDTNGTADAFVVARSTGAVRRVSVAGTGTQGNGASVTPSLSAGGRYVAFASYATNLAPGDTNGQPDIFLRDTRARTTTRVGGAAEGRKGKGR